MTTVLLYLQTQRKINLMKSEYDELSAYLTDKRKATYFIFTDNHKKMYLSQLDPQLFSTEELQNYYNEFNGSKETEIGKPMMDGIRAIQQSLKNIDESSVVVFSIG